MRERWLQLWKTPVTEFLKFVFAYLLVHVLELVQYSEQFLMFYCINIYLNLCLLLWVVKRVTTCYVRSFGSSSVPGY